MDDSLQPEGLRAHGLPAWVGRILRFGTVSSTMDIARHMAGRADADGAIIIAETQLAGRGRRGSRWVDRTGASLTFSVVFISHAADDVLGLYSLAAALAVADALGQLGIDARTKWPNDVLVSGRKIAGILVETTPISEIERQIVAGIGVNVGQTRGELEGIGDTGTVATSAMVELGSLPDRGALLAAILRGFDALIEVDRTPRAGDIVARWRRADVCIGAALEVRMGAGASRGTGRDITDAGLLIVETEGAGRLALSSAEVRVRPTH